MSRVSGSPDQIDKLTLAERLCLNFANTVDWRLSGRPQEYLTGYPDLVRWSKRTGLLTEKEAQRLLREAARHPRQAAVTFERAIELRDRVFRIFSAIAAARQPELSDLDALNGALSAALSRLRIVPAAEAFQWEWVGANDALDRMLWPIVRSAGELLTSEELSRVRECAGETCGWLFEDVSRNRLRRWCEMKSCGNRAKARRHYERIKRIRKDRARPRGR
jgi:predicted RNA-binding Zn ribbon-like protein